MDYSHTNDTSYPGGAKVAGTPGLILTDDVPNNGRILRNLAMASNYLMSHILHFYHLVALDYVDVNGTGLIPKGFTCPNYDSNYYARGIDPVLQTGGLGAPAYTVNNAPVANPGIPAAVLGDLTPYLAAQYVRALKARRMAHQLGAIFAGKMPHASAYTPGCMTTKAYDPSPTGPDAAVVQKVHELLYGGPGFDPTSPGGLSPSSPHPVSLLGFIGKPSDFWSWAGDTSGPNTGGLGIGFEPSYLPPWAQLGVPAADPTAGGSWKYGGTMMFDVVAAAHVFPEYFWIGSGYGRYLAWGIFEGEDVMGFGDNRLITRGRTHIPRNANGSGQVYGYAHQPADHLQAKEFTTNSWYDEPKGINYGRHMWKGKTKANPDKAGAYTFAKTPRYYNNESATGWEATYHPNDAYLPYEVGPLARGMSNASGLTTPGGPATVGEVLAVDAGSAYAYYPGILADVDNALQAPVSGGGTSPIGVFPAWGTNAAAHITFLAGAGVYYLPPNAMSPLMTNGFFYSDYMGGATLDRIAARAMETYFVAMQMLNWFNALDPTKPSNKTLSFSYFGKDNTAPKKGKGAGLTEAPRGALGHWVVLGKGKGYKTSKGTKKWKKWAGKVANYQIITPTAWNINPKDAADAGEKTLGLMGPIERCIWQTPLVSEAEPLEILRVIHSFDPCCACTVHVMNPKQEKVFEATLETTF